MAGGVLMRKLRFGMIGCGKISIENMSKDIFTMFKVVKLDKIFNITLGK
jgi:hypothetical protein